MARTKKRRNSSSSRLIDEPIDEHMENQSIRVEELQNTDDETDGDVEAKKTRGPTYMTSVWGQPTSHRYKVKFNKLGKPVGKNKSRFTEFLGTISRNGSYAPIDVQDWRKIDNSRKKDMLKIVREKFDVPPSAKIWILRALGKYWRNWKTWIKATYYKPNIQVETQMLNLDVRVVKDQ